jgi:hypothetical protein
MVYFLSSGFLFTVGPAFESGMGGAGISVMPHTTRGALLSTL